MNLDHLSFPNYGWGYMPPTKEVFSIFEYIQKKYTPKNILEIGFHLGHSTTYQLNIFNSAKICSVSPEVEYFTTNQRHVSSKQRIQAALDLYELYPARWKWIRGSTKKSHVQENISLEGPFDFALVDGSHKFGNVLVDIDICKENKVKVIAADNWEKEEVVQAFNISSYKLERVFEYECTFKSKTTKVKMGVLTSER